MVSRKYSKFLEVEFDTNKERQIRNRIIVSLTKAKQFLWRGMGTDTVSNDPQKNAKKIDKAVTKMFQKFGPSAK